MSLVPFVEIDLDALSSNYGHVADVAGPAVTAAVVKADAYGLGVGPVAKRLSTAGCRHFFVATVTEGMELRSLLREPKIYVLDGPLGDAPGDFLGHGLIPVLNSIEQARVWAGAGQAALHIDTGMNRLGLSAGELMSLIESVPDFPRGELALVMTHLACADEPDHPLNKAQLRIFDEVARLFPGVPTSIGNSAGALLSPEFRGDIVRAGIALYGGNPFVGRENPIGPVVSLRAPVIQVRTLEHAESIGYGASYAGEQGARIATVALGYADGYPRALGNAGVAAIAGMRVPVVGRVSMDLLCLDVSAVPAAAVSEGVYVELFGREIAIDEVAHTAGTISYELLTGLGRRVERRYVGEQEGGQ